MEKTITVEQDGSNYWNMSYAFLKVVAMELNEALKDSGVTDAEARQQICSRFGSGFGNFLDQYWMEIDGKKCYPLVCFSDQFLNSGTDIQEIAPLYITNKEFEFHGAADDATIEFFKSHAENLDSGKLRVGFVGQDEE